MHICGAQGDSCFKMLQIVSLVKTIELGEQGLGHNNETIWPFHAGVGTDSRPGM